MEDPSLLSSISWYSAARLDTVRTDSIPRKAGRRVADSTPLNTAPTSDSVLFLRVQAAADYFSLDQSLMENVPPVAADLVLDPFLLNVFPRSLVPTAGWIVVVAGVAAVVARWITGEFRGLAREGGVIREGKKKK